jgi:hypothetical protein
LWTTAPDLARYAIGVQQALIGRSKAVLSAATARAMLIPGLNHHGLGPAVGGTTTQKYFAHKGGNEGFQCQLVAYEDGDGAVVMTNSDSGDSLIVEILRTIAHEYGWPDLGPPARTVAAVGPNVFDRYTGAYRLPSGAIATFWRDGTRFYSRIEAQPTTEMLSMSEQEYFLTVEDTRFLFSFDPNRETTAVTAYSKGEEQHGTRLSDGEGQPLVDESRRGDVKSE